MNLYGVSINEDSICSVTGNRLTTFLLTYPRIIHAELLTHRVFSRNSASSRAIPASKMIRMVENNTFIPLGFLKEHSGMQGYDFFEGQELEEVKELWLKAANFSIGVAKEMLQKKVTKQLINRILEPYSYITVLLTASDFTNWFNLRIAPTAEIHIQQLARMMLDAYNSNTPKILHPGECHIAFGDNISDKRLERLELPEFLYEETKHLALDKLTLKKMFISSARSARTSYINFEGKDDYEADLNFTSRLLNDRHMSCFEHAAINMGNSQYYANFKGFKQLRTILEK